MEIQDRYEIKRKLGQGGVGAVYEGYDRQLKRRVAIKRLLTDSEDEQSKESVDELLRECHSLSALNSPNIVSLYDFGEDSDGPFVVMELLEGETLEELIERAPFTEADFHVLAEQSLEGIVAAHDAHLLHRDLKPCNLMVTWLPSGRMQLKVLDFGLAKFSVEPTKQTIAHGNSLFGSIYFMAPEQFEQLPLDGRTDLYSLGAIFYYALAGVYPFDGDSVAQVMAGHLTGNYKDLRQFRPDVNPELCKWVMTLMSRHPEERPESAQVALTQFVGILRGTFSPPEPEAARSVTSPIAVKAPTSRLQMPAVDTSAIVLDTGQVSVKSVKNPTEGVVIEGDQTIYGMPKWVWFTLGGVVGLILILLLAFGGDSDDEEPVADQQNEEPEEAIELPSGKVLRDKLRLPDSVTALMQRYDSNKDGLLSIEEFSTAPKKSLQDVRRRYFPRIDKDKDSYLNPTELNRAYRSKG